MKHKHYLIMYDICDPKRLREVEKIVSLYGVRVQRSVFESDVDERMINNLRRRLDGIVIGDDFVAIIPLCERDWQKSEKYGILFPNQYIVEDFAIL